jgi:two-component system, cell cycle sensor histidine kinase and response regulator CckA
MLQKTDGSLIHSEKQSALTQIQSFRNQTVNRVYFAIAVVTPFILATGLYRAMTLGWKPLMYWQSVSALLIIITVLFHKRIAYRFRVLTIICIFFISGIGGLLTWGLMGMGVYFFIFGNLIANLCFGVKVGFPLTLATLVCMVMSALAGHYQWVGVDLDFNHYAWAPSSWTTMILTTGAFLGIFHWGLHRYFSYLTEMIKSLDHRSNQLIDMNRRLEEEIVERDRSEKALRDSEEKYRMVVDNAGEGIVVLRNGKILFANNMILNKIDMPLEDFGHKNVDDFLYPDDRQFGHRVIKRLLKGEIDFVDREIRLLDGKGAYRWFSMHSVRTQWEKQPAIIAFLYEITDRKSTEAEKARLQARLKQAEKLEILGMLAGAVAHDLNNVLMGATTYPDYLLTKVSEESKLRKPLGAIKKSGEKAVAIVQDMLTLARRRVKVSEICNLNHITSEFLDSPEFKKMRSYNPATRVEKKLDNRLKNIKGSPIHLGKTIMNLVSNALESLTDGGRIWIVTENRTIAFQPNNKKGVNPKAGEYVVLRITDNGSGISPDDIEKIFEPFYTKKTMGKSGTGLGMVVVWNAVQDHGGYIDVDSIEGRGTTFTLFFPVTTARPESTQADRPIAMVKGNNENVLVVDDSEEHRQMAIQCLTDLGYNPAASVNGLAAVEHIKENRVDLAVLDMVMAPGPDGLETYKRMQCYNPDLKAVIISGFQETERVREAQKLGAGPFLEKPFKFEDLGTAVKKELAGSMSPTQKLS